jgi:D-3-phosphoglycerate dehydrogenase / 2-oxoglutarate reductase
VLVADRISQDAIRRLESSGIEFDFKPEISPNDLESMISTYDAVIVRSRTQVTKEVIDAGKNLKVIGRAGVGVDNIDIEESRRRNIAVLNTPNALTNSVAEFTLGLMLSLSRKIPSADFSMKRGEWEKTKFLGSELRGKTYGTIGIGKIGQKVAELSKAFGMNIVANDVIPIPPALVERLNIRVSTQEEVFSMSDFVDIHVPLTKETENLANYEKFRIMKKTAFLINTSRGKVVNERDLQRALEAKLIAGAALDVYETEPPNFPSLIQRSDLIATSHIAGQTVEAQSESGVEIVEAVLRVLKSP